MNNISLIVAMDQNRVIGKDGSLPWRLKADMEHFAEFTWGKVVVMGRKTYDSIPSKFKPLKHRGNVILTRNRDFISPGCRVVHSVDAVLEMSNCYRVCVIGGKEVYELLLPYADLLVVTHVGARVGDGVTFPDVLGDWSPRQVFVHKADEENQFSFSVTRYTRITGARSQ